MTFGIRITIQGLARRPDEAEQLILSGLCLWKHVPRGPPRHEVLIQSS